MDARHIRGCDVPTHSTCRTVFTVPRSQSLQYTASMYVHNTSVHVCGACGCVRDGEHVHNVSVPVCGACVRVSVALLSSLSDSIYSTYEYESLRTDKTDRQVRLVRRPQSGFRRQQQWNNASSDRKGMCCGGKFGTYTDQHPRSAAFPSRPRSAEARLTFD